MFSIDNFINGTFDLFLVMFLENFINQVLYFLSWKSIHFF